MKSSLAFVFFVCSAGAVAAMADARNPALDIVSRYETTFSAPPSQAAGGSTSRATDAPLLGNGDLGVCFSGPPDKQIFWVTKNDFWYLKNGHAVPLNFGMLHLAAPALSNACYAVRQTLVDAITTATFTGRDSTVTETAFVAATTNVMVLALSCRGKPVEMEITFQPNFYFPEEKNVGEDHGICFATRGITNQTDIPVEATVAWKMRGADAAKFTLMPGHPVTLLLSMVSSFDARDTKAGAISMLKDARPAALEAAHKAWWRGFWGKSFVEIPDADIMRRYYISQYIMASASRNPKFPPAIIGPWATGRTGWCGYWMNYNHAAPYYGLYSSNHIQQADPQDTPILEFMPVGEKHAREILNCRGVLYPVGIGPLGLDACGLAAPTVTNRQYEKGICTWGQRSDAAYNLVNMGQRWYTTYDLDYGRKIYPYAKAVADFWEDYLTLEDDGHGGQRYVINNESVQEGSGTNKNPIASLGLVRNTFRLMLDLSKELNRDAGRRAKWEDILARLSGFPTKEWGAEKKPIFILTEKGPVLWGSNTCNIQHIYPAGAIGLDSPPELLAIARNTIAIVARWQDANGANSFFPAAARVGFDPKVILRELHYYSTANMKPNGFSAGGNPHGIENCSTVPNTIDEMLMQSHEGVIRFFPVWPEDKDARFGTLRACGAFLVSAELKGGVISGVKITSEKGRDCTVVNPWPGKAVRVIRNGSPAELVTGDRFTIKTAAGETIGLEPREKK